MAGRLRDWGRFLLKLGLCSLAGYVAWLCLIIPVYRFVDPPLSTLILTQAWMGQMPIQTWRPLSEISPNVIKAVLISEDGQFCQHWGVDWSAVSEAMQHNGRGASTIPMQTVKNLFLGNGRTYVRKLLEVPLAYATTLIWGRRRTLEIYLNIAEWGPGIFGIEAAAQYHFHQSARSLSPSQAALLAAALPNPIRRNAGKPNPVMRGHASIVRRQFGDAEAEFACVLAAG